jgi:integrase
MPVRRDNKRKRWFFRFTAQTPTGKRSVYGCPGTPGPFQHLTNTKEGALEAERIARQHLKHEVDVAAAPPAPIVPTLSEFCDQFYFEKMATIGNKHGKNKPGTLRTKRSHVKRQLGPRFGHLRLDQIDAIAIEDFKIASIHHGREASTVNTYLTTLHNILATARKRGHLAVAPAIEWFRVGPTEFDFLDFEEAERLIEAAATAMPAWHAPIVLALKTGMRLGELRGLRWQDVDLVSGQLTVCRNLPRDVEGTPKSGRSRTIDLSITAVKALKAHRHLRERVFSSPEGTDYTPFQWSLRLGAVCKRAGLRKIGWHVLRHTTTSHLVMRGVPMKAIAELLGHSSITMTNRYAHLAPGAMRVMVAKLDEAAPRWDCSVGAAPAVSA